jgi:hypothetical protein
LGYGGIGDDAQTSYAYRYLLSSNYVSQSLYESLG